MYPSKPISTVGKGSEINCLNIAELYKRFRGVVGYHIRLTRGRSPVRTRTKTYSFYLFSRRNFVRILRTAYTYFTTKE